MTDEEWSPEKIRGAIPKLGDWVLYRRKSGAVCPAIVTAAREGPPQWWNGDYLVNLTGFVSDNENLSAGEETTECGCGCFQAWNVRQYVPARLYVRNGPTRLEIPWEQQPGTWMWPDATPYGPELPVGEASRAAATSATV